MALNRTPMALGAEAARIQVRERVTGSSRAHGALVATRSVLGYDRLRCGGIGGHKRGVVLVVVARARTCIPGGTAVTDLSKHSWFLRCFAIAATAGPSTIACDTTVVAVTLLLEDLCDEPNELNATGSVKITLASYYGFTDEHHIDGCLEKSRCLNLGEELPAFDSFSSLQLGLSEVGHLIETQPGNDRMLVLTGFTTKNCAPDPTPEPFVSFCGFNIANLTDSASHVLLPVHCAAGPASTDVCWRNEFFDTCE